MILLDTNIISELMRPRPATRVLRWFESQDMSELAISAVTIGELNYGIAVLPEGRRRTALHRALHHSVDEAFADRTYPYDAAAAEIYGVLMAQRRRTGRPMSVPDGQIAAIALANELDMATRNILDFEGLDLSLINPFSAQDRQ